MEEQELSLEDEFSMRKFEIQVEALQDLDSAKDLIYFLRRQLMMREMIYRAMLRHHLIDG